ncbi:MAG: GDP-mannose 4,6-dehydratase, partial [Bdellovibrionota bacterium]
MLSRKGYRLLGVSRDGPVDVRKPERVLDLVKRFKPDEIYYLAAYHHSSQEAAIAGAQMHRRSWEVNVLGLVNFLEAMKAHRPAARLFYAASARVFGDVGGGRANEKTGLAPNDVYGITKAMGLMVCRLYRRHHGLFASVGILFNHESSLRAPIYVTRKIVQAAAAIKKGRAKELVLGSLDDEIDCGYAPDFARAMLAIVGRGRADDFIVSSGKKHSIREFVSTAFSALGLDWRQYVRV